MKTFVRTGLTLLALSACGQTAGFAQEIESNLQQEQRLNEVNNYMAHELDESVDQVTTVTGFSDVQPTDWAYQALKRLVEGYGCVAGYPDSGFRGNRSISRYEAAALLNACLERISAITDEIRRLIREFEPELAILKGKVDGLEANIGELEAMQFSTTTKLNVFAVWNLNANSFSGSGKSDDYNEANGGTTYAYTILPMLKTSFTGKDMFEVIFSASNFDLNSPSCGNPYLGSASAYCLASENKLEIYRMFYKFPIGEDIEITVSPRMQTFDYITVGTAALSPKSGNLVGLRNLYNDMITFTNVPAAYPYIIGGGAAIKYKKNGWAADFGYLTSNSNSSDSTLGMGGGKTQGNMAAQLSYSSQRAGFQLGWTRTQYGDSAAGSTFYYMQGTPLATNPFSENVFVSPAPMTVQTGGLAGYWYITEDFSISGGVNLGFYESDLTTQYSKRGDEAMSKAWLATLQWERFPTEETTIGFAFGQPSSIQWSDATLGEDHGDPWIAMANLTWQVNNYITVTPIIYWFQGMGGNQDQNGSSLGASLMTTFYF
ncbi:iron uptake porin [Synechococcus sp. CC9605]|uniref:iron uptake porin n=1 Tax=Synechococcus sp. (strain CC9605) TaxID=110662 RepID=UPI00005D5889|nr:iron uptake porin [Synechococcus sp. CC9605]ABB34601.1 possible porin [Synechococcus sp. CC9605]